MTEQTPYIFRCCYSTLRALSWLLKARAVDDFKDHIETQCVAIVDGYIYATNGYMLHAIKCSDLERNGINLPERDGLYALITDEYYNVAVFMPRDGKLLDFGIIMELKESLETLPLLGGWLLERTSWEMLDMRIVSTGEKTATKITGMIGDIPVSAFIMPRQEDITLES